MAGAIETAYVELRADTSRFQQEARRAGSTAGDESGRGFGRGFGGAIMAAGAALGGGALLSFGINAAASLEMAEVGFAGLLGSGEAAEEMMGRLTDFAATTPLELPGLADMTKNLLAMGGTFGVTEGNVLDFVTTIGDVTSVLGGGQAQMDAVTRTLGQMGSLGRVSAGDMNQLANALPGFNVWQTLADGMGMSVAEVRALSEAGELASEDAIPMLLAGMEEFPGAAGAMARSSQTLTGVLSTFKDTAQIALAEGLGPLVEGLKENLASDAILGPLQGAFASFGTLASEAFGAIAPAVGPLLESLGTVFDDIGRIIGSLAPIVEPIVGLLGMFATTLSEGLGDAFEALAPAIELVGGFIGDLSDVLAGVFMTAWDALQPAITAIAGVLTDSLAVILPIILQVMEDLSPIIGDIAELMGDVLAEVVEDLADIFVEMFEAVAPLIPILAEGLLFVLEELEPILPILVKAFIAWKLAMGPLGIALKALALAQAALNAVMALNPIVLVVAAIAALGAALVAAYFKFEGFRNFVDSAWQKMQEVWDWVTTFFVDVWHDLQGAVDAVASAFGTAFEAAKGFVVDNLGFVLDYVAGIGEFFRGIVDTVKQLFSGEWGAAWQTFKDTVVNFAGEVLAYLGGLGGLILDALRLGAGKLLEAGQWIAEQIVGALPGIADWFLGLPGLILDKAVDFLSVAAEWVANIVGYLLPGIVDFVKALPGRIVDAAIDFFSVAAGWVGSIAGPLLSGIVDFVKALPGRIIDAGIGFAQMVYEWANDIGPELVDWVVGFVVGLPGAILDKAIDFIQVVSQWVANIVGPLLSGIAAFVVGLPGKLIEMIPQMVAKLAAFGGEIASEIWTGIREWVADRAGDLVDIFTSDGDPGEFLAASVVGSFLDHADGIISDADLRPEIEDLFGRALTDTEWDALSSIVEDGMAAGLSPDDLATDILDWIEGATDGAASGTRTRALTLADFMTKEFAKGVGTGFTARVVPVFKAGPKDFAAALQSQAPSALKAPGRSLIDGMRAGIDAALVNIRVQMFGMSVKFVSWLGNLSGTFRVSGGNLMAGLRDGMLVGMNGVVQPWLRGTGLRLLSATPTLGGLLVQRGVALMSGLRDGIAVGWSRPRGWLAGVGLRVIQAVGSLNSTLYGAGASVMQGFAAGLRDNAWIVYVQAAAIARNIERIIKSALQIGSPSRVFEDIGADTMLGFQLGLQSGWGGVVGALGDVTDQIGRFDVGAQAGGGAGGGINVVVEFHGALPTDDQAYAAGLSAAEGVADGLAQRRIRTLTRTAG